MNLIPRSFLLDDFFGDVSKFKIHDMKCDIYEENNNYVVEMDVPGYSKDEIDIEVNRGYLTIGLSHKGEDEVSDKNYIRKERVYGTTKREFYVGDVDEEGVKASFNEGVLKVIVPKREEASVKRKIEIE